MPCQATSFVGVHRNDWTRRNWDEEVTFAPADYWEPAHSSETAIDGLSSVVRAVIEASNAGQSIHAIGSGWAFEDLAASNGAMISLRQLDRQLDYVVGKGSNALTPDWRTRQDDDKSPTVLVHVEAGIRIATLNELLAKQGLAMPTLGGSNGQTLAGALSTSTHGGDWDQTPFPDLVRAIHMVGDDGKEQWIEPADERRRITVSDAELRKALPCSETEIVHDDRVFDAAVVSCGRFGVIYSLVLEVRRAFRVVEAVNTPGRAEILEALRTGISQRTLFAPLYGLLNPLPVPAGLPDAKGTPYFMQILFNSQNPDNVWVHRRWETSEPDNIPDDHNVVQGQADLDGLTALAIIPVVDVALDTAATAATLIPGLGLAVAAYITLDVKTEYHAELVGKTRLGDVVAAALRALWKVPLAGHAVPQLNGTVIGSRFKDAIANGRRGPHYLLTSGTREDSDNDSFKSASIEVVFDATRSGYIDFLDEILPQGPRFRQAGYVSLRPSRASRAWLSMHGVDGTHTMSIEVASLAGLPDNDVWMSYIQRRAIAYGGRPHWGQYNKLTALGSLALGGVKIRSSSQFQAASPSRLA